MNGPRPAGRPWTLADDNQLRELFDSGMHTDLIAQKLKRTLAAVRTRKSLNTLGLNRKEVAPRANEPWTPEEDNQLQILMAEGKTARTIASHFNRTTRAIRRRTEILKLSWLKVKGK